MTSTIILRRKELLEAHIELPLGIGFSMLIDIQTILMHSSTAPEKNHQPWDSKSAVQLD